MGKEPFYRTVPWSPFYYTSKERYIHPESKCDVCGYCAECYLDNTYYCLEHGDTALRRHNIVHHMIKEANEKGNYATEHLFEQQPDLHCHAKWLRILEGTEKYTPPNDRKTTDNATNNPTEKAE